MPKAGLDPRRSLEQQLIWTQWRATNGGQLDEPCNAKMAREIAELQGRLAALRENNTQKNPVKTGT